jgi:hypothetical protein
MPSLPIPSAAAGVGSVTRRARKAVLGSLAAGAALAALSGAAAASETRGFVVGWFYPAIYFADEACPDGPNPLSEVFYHRILKDMGYTPAEVEKHLEGFPNEGTYKEITTVRGRNKENVFANPTSVPDPGMKYAQGTKSYGFNLDGKEDANSFTDPETGEKGVDNQLFRVLGCVQSHRAPPPARPTYLQAIWDILRDQMPAFVIEVSGIDDMKNDDDVEVGIYRALEPPQRDTTGETRGDMTFRIDPDPRSQNHVHGRIKDGMLITDTAETIHLVGDPFAIPEFNFKKAKLRLTFAEDGSAKGILGAYHDWRPIYWHYGSAGWVVEHSSGIEIPAVYYGLKKFADAFPDPKTGENTAISLAYQVEVKPAFLVHPTESSKVAAAPAAPAGKAPTQTAENAKK